MYFLLSFGIFTVVEEHLEKKGFWFDTVKEIVILEVVTNAFQSGEVVDVGKVVKASKLYVLRIVFTL